MSNENKVREGVQQAKVGEIGLSVITIQVFGLSSIAWYFSGSFGWGILAFLVLTILLFSVAENKKASMWLSYAMGIAVMVLSFVITLPYEEIGAFTGFMIALILGAVTAGGNILGMQYIRDIIPKEIENKE